MKVMVTGATGFVGNHVIEYLLSKSIQVIASSSSETKAKQYDWFDKVTYKEWGLTQPPNNDLYAYFEKPDKLIHLAWGGLPNYKDLFHFEKNLFESYFFLKQLAEDGLKDFTVIGTCFEYGMQEGKLSETLLTNPSNPYGLAKDTLRKFLEELQSKLNFSFKWVRLFYMYGKGQHEKSLLSQLEKALQTNQDAFNMSGGEQLRDYLPIEKVAENIVSIALQDKMEGIINCCNGTPISIRSLVENYLITTQRNIKLNLKYYPYPDYEPFAFWGDNTKLKTILKNGI